MIGKLKWTGTSILIVAFLLSALQTSIAQKSTLEGTIKDAGTGEPLIGATVYIKGTSIGNVTDYDGKYRVVSIPEGSYEIEAQYLGYQTKTIHLDFTGSKKVIQDFELGLESILAEEITISAQAEGQVSAINQQLNDNTIKNIVSSKKIQEVPDANAAETLGRLPGVSIVRSGGEGSKVVVRGLAPKFNKVQVEGVKMAATGGDDRSSDLSMISPYMLEAIEVSKAAMADQEADVIGGSVNFVLREAPKNRMFDILLQTGYSSLNSNLANQKLVLGGSNRFFNKKLGVFAQVDLEQRDRSSDELSVFYGRSGSNELDSFPISTDKVFLKDVRRSIKRGGATVVLDYKIPAGSIKLSNFVSVIKKNEISRYETYNNIMPFHEYGLADFDNTIRVMTNALKMKKAFGAFTVDAGLSYSYSDNDSPKGLSFSALETNAYTKQLPTTMKADSILFYANNDITKANVQRISNQKSFTKEGEYAAGLNLQYEWNITKKINLRIKSGVKYKKLNKEFSKELFTIPVKDSGHGTPFRKEILKLFPRLSDEIGLDASKLPYHLFTDPNYERKTFGDEQYYVQNAADIDFINQLGEVAEDFYFKNHEYSNRDNYHGTEDYKAAYILSQFNIGKRMTFIPGVRYEDNTTSYNANRGDNNTLLWNEGYDFHDTTIVRNNSYLLPMIHLKIKPSKWLDIRMAYTQTLARPSYSQIVPKWNVGLNSVSWNNPFLTPSLSTNYDIQISAYNNKLGLLTVGGFYKSIENLIFNAGRSVIKEEDIIDNGLAENLLGTSISKTINNSNAGELYGVELEWQTRFWYLDNFLNGLILNINYTHTFSSVDYERTVLKRKFVFEPVPMEILIEESNPYNERLVYQPTDIFNLTLGYDYKGLSSRLSFLYQNDIFSRPNFFRQLRGATDEYFRVDLNLNQKLPWKGFSLLMNFSNLTSAPERDLLISNGNPTKRQYYGFTLDLGVRYKIQ